MALTEPRCSLVIGVLTHQQVDDGDNGQNGDHGANAKAAAHKQEPIWYITMKETEA